MTKFDAIVIGSGQGGNPLSHNLADKGWNVARWSPHTRGRARERHHTLADSDGDSGR